ALHLGNAGAVVASSNNQAVALLGCGRPSEVASLLTATLERFSRLAEPEGIDYSRVFLARSILEIRGPGDQHAQELLDTAIKNGRNRRSRRAHTFALATAHE